MTPPKIVILEIDAAGGETLKLPMTGDDALALYLDGQIYGDRFVKLGKGGLYERIDPRSVTPVTPDAMADLERAAGFEEWTP